MIRVICALLLFVAVAAPAAADTYSVGTVQDGYTYQSDGFWHWGADPYTRYWTAGQPASFYYVNGCRYYNPGTSGYWTYKRYHPPAVEATVKGAEPVDLIEQRLIQFAQDQAKWESDRAKAITKQQYHLELAGALGLKRPNGTLPYSAGYAGLYAGNLQIGGLNVVPSNTLYSTQNYSLKQTVTTNDPAFDANAALQLSAQATKNAQDWGGKSNELTNGLIDKAIEYQAKVKQIEADAAAFQQRIESLKERNTTLTTERKVSTTQPTDPPPAQATGGAAALRAHFAANCVSCHGEANAAGGYSLSGHLSKGAAYQARVYDRVRPDADAKIRMPRGADGQAGHPLTWAEAALYAPGAAGK